MIYKGYVVAESVYSGKATNGNKKTSSIQAFRGAFLEKYFRFTVGDDESKRKAKEKALAYIDKKTAGDTQKSNMIIYRGDTVVFRCDEGSTILASEDVTGVVCQIYRDGNFAVITQDYGRCVVMQREVISISR